MKVNDKERSKSKSISKLQQKKINSENVKKNNPFIPIKYFCFNEVKKIVNNNKNKKSQVAIRNNEKPKSQNINQKIKKEEEDEYSQFIYNKRLIIPHNMSFSNLLSLTYSLFKNEENNIYINYWKSTDERYNQTNKYGFNTKKIIRICKEKSSNIKNNHIKKSKFIKKNRLKKKNKNRIKIDNNKNVIDIHNINNLNTNNIIYRGNSQNIYESYNNTLTSNTITSKTITNNTMSNYTISNVSHNSYYNKPINTNTNTNSNASQNLSINKENKDRRKSNKINNINVITNKGRNKLNNMIKSQRNRNMKYNEKENTVFVRRIILEEKFTIDSKGDKKTIYIKKISPAIKTQDIIKSADKRLMKNKRMVKDNNNNKDNTYINHNDINLNFNVCSFQKINLNNNNINKKMTLKQKAESFDDDYFKYDNNNDIITNQNILQNYKDFLNIKNCNKMVYQKPNGIYHSEKNHKSYQSLFPSQNKRYIIKLIGNDLGKYKSKINKKAINNPNKKNEIGIKKKSTNTPLKYMQSYPRCLKNKVVHRKTKTNLNNIEFEKLMDCQEEDEEKDNIVNSRSLSFIGKKNVYNLVKKLKDTKKSELKEKLKNGNNSLGSRISSKNPAKINEYFHFSPLNSGINSKSNSKKNSINNSKYIKKKSDKNKSNLYKNIKESNENNSRSHSLNKITSKNNYNSNEFKSFLNYLDNNMDLNSGRNKSHRKFLIKRYEKYNLDYILNKSKKNNCNNKNGNYSNLIYMIYKVKEKSCKK